MGYQESYITTKKTEDFATLVKAIQEVGADYYREAGARPVEIIYVPRDKRSYIYFAGERYVQRDFTTVLGYDEFQKKDNPDRVEKYKRILELGNRLGARVTAKHEEFVFPEEATA